MNKDELLVKLANMPDEEKAEYVKLKKILEADRYTIKKPNAGQIFVCNAIEGMHDLVLTYIDNFTGEKYGIVKVRTDSDSPEPDKQIAIKESNVKGVYEKIPYMPAEVTRVLLDNTFTK